MERIQLRRDTSEKWASVNPVLMEGEVGIETDTKLRKVGDGVNAWNSLDYLAAENIVQELGDSENATVSQETISNELYLRTLLNTLVLNNTDGQASNFADVIADIPLEQRFAGQIIANQDRLNRWIFRYNIFTRNHIDDTSWNTPSSWEELYSAYTLPEVPNTSSTTVSFFRQGFQNVQPRYRRYGLRADVTLNRNDEDHKITYHAKYLGPSAEADMLNETIWDQEANWKFFNTCDELPEAQTSLLSTTVIDGYFVVCDNESTTSNNGKLIQEEGAFSTDFIYCKGLKTVYYTGYARAFSGMAFYDKDKKYIGCNYELRHSTQEGSSLIGNWFNNFPVSVPEDAYWLVASSRSFRGSNQPAITNRLEVRGELPKDNLYQQLQDVLDTDTIYLNGVDGVAIMNNEYSLKEDGDSLEFESFIFDRDQQPSYDAENDIQSPNVFYSLFGYNFITPTDKTRFENIIGFPNAIGQIMVRALDGTWLFNNPGSVSTNVWNTFKMDYNNGRIDLYVNGELISSYQGQKEFIVKYIGAGYDEYRIRAKVRNLKINGNTIDFFDNSKVKLYNVYPASNTNSTTSDVDLTTVPEQYYIKTSDELIVYYRRYSNNYIAYHLYKRYKAWDASIASAGTATNYYDNWGIEQCTEEEFNGASFTKLRDLYRTGETELAIRVNGNAYVGGATHGYENIRNDGQTRMFNIFIDGKMVSEEAESEGEFTNISVNMSSYLAHMQTQNNFLQADKEWVFADKKFKLSTKIKFLEAARVNDCMTAMLLCLRNQVTTSSMKSTDIYKVYDISMDSWVDNPENSSLTTRDANAKWIRNWSSKYSFQLTSLEDNRTTGGGMFVTTNGSSYNKIYLELARGYSAKENEELYSVTEFTNL